MPFDRVLFSTHTSAQYMPPPRYGLQQIVCGPDYKNETDSNGIQLSVQAPLRKPYDCASLIQALPPDQRPEVLIARVDGSLDNMPRNVAAAGIPTIGIFGDSHHMRNPLQNLIDYALQEKFDYVILDHNRQHAHWYLEAGVRNILWVPGLLLADQFLPPVPDTSEQVMFVGQVGSWHPYRRWLIDQLSSTDLTLNIKQVPQSRAALEYNKSRVSMNCSLNGDLNLRVFEILASGGLLLTDKLSAFSGLYDLYDAEKDFVQYKDAEEFLDQANALLKDDCARYEIAQSGYRRTSKLFGLEARQQVLQRLVRQGTWDELFSVQRDPRSGFRKSVTRDRFVFRVRVYEQIQELHRTHPLIRVINESDGDARFCCDFADLPRAEICSHPGINNANAKIFRYCGLENMVKVSKTPPDPPPEQIPVITLCSASGLTRSRPGAAHSVIILVDWPELVERQRQEAKETLASLGYSAFDLDGMAIRKEKPGVNTDVASRILQRFPKLTPVPDGIPRPTWSVMIPAYNTDLKLLQRTLESVLNSGLDPDKAQIEVIDDGSENSEEIQAVVSQCGQGKIGYFKQQENVGMCQNWNTCLERTTGHWIHLLHADDLILPGFYDHIPTDTFEKGTVGAAFCRHFHIDINDVKTWRSPLEQNRSGLLSNSALKMAEHCRLQPPAIAIRRSAYESVGLYSADAASALDWELWIRVASRFPVWYEPEPLACYRRHEENATSTLLESGQQIRDVRKVISLARSYLPSEIAETAARRANKYYALYAMEIAEYLFSKGKHESAQKNIDEGLKCDRSPEVIAAMNSALAKATAN